MISKILKYLRRHLKDPLFRNSCFLISNYIIIAVLGFIFFVLVARYYTPHDVGLAVAIISASNLLVTLSLPGLGSGIVRFLPNERDKPGMINSCFTITLLLSIPIAGIFILGINIWSPTLAFLYHGSPFLLIFFIFVSMTALVSLQRYIFIALRSSQFSLFQNIILSLLKIIFVSTLVKFNVLGIIFSCAIAILITFIIGTFFFIPKIVHSFKPMPTINRGIIKNMLNVSLGNYIAENIGALPSMVLPLMIIHLLNSELNAYFFMASNISNLLFMVPVSICSCLLAEGSFSRDMFRANAIKAIKLMIILIIPIILGIFIFGNKLLLLFGEKYAENGYYMLCILVLSLIPGSVITLYSTIRNVRLEVKSIIYLDIFLTVIQIAISYLLVIKIGLIGVAIGILLSQTIGAIIALSLAIKEGWIWSKSAHLLADSS